MKVTLKALIKELHALRLKRDRADAAFLLRCVEVEAKYWPRIHRELHIASFAQFLKSNALCDPARFENFKRGMEKIGRDKALEIGGHATIVAARLSGGADKVKKYTAAIAAWRLKYHGAQPSSEAAERILRQMDPRESVPAPVKESRLIDRLRAENTELRAQLRIAWAQLKELDLLRVENAELRVKVREAQAKAKKIMRAEARA